MKPEIKSEWVKALRSGQYAQAKNTLRDDAGAFCCLGVLLDISKRGEWAGEGLYVLEWGYDGDPLVSCEGDLDNLRGTLGVPAEVEKELVHKNDDLGEDFNKIADYIESVL